MLKFSSTLYLAPVISQCQLFPFNAMRPQWHARLQKCYDGVKNAQSPGLCITLSIPMSDLLSVSFMDRRKKIQGILNDSKGMIILSFFLPAVL